MTPKDTARGLAWFGIGLGLVELVAPRAVARATGLQGHANVIRLYGLREAASGAVMLAARDPQAWLWTRVLGDALDGALLASRFGPSNPRRGRALVATLVVSPVVALDVMHAEAP